MIVPAPAKPGIPCGHCLRGEFFEVRRHEYDGRPAVVVEWRCNSCGHRVRVARAEVKR